jgi:hypothetical protein
LYLHLFFVAQLYGDHSKAENMVTLGKIAPEEELVTAGVRDPSGRKNVCTYLLQQASLDKSPVIKNVDGSTNPSEGG